MPAPSLKQHLLRRAVTTKAPLGVQFLLTFGGEGRKSKKLWLYYVKKGGREGSIESQQKFDFFSNDGTPKT